VLRALDPAAGVFRAFTGPLNDRPALKPTITNSFEGGYKGLVGGRTLIDAAVYVSRRQNFIAPLSVLTPNVFLSTPSLAAYLARFMPAATAAALAAGIGGVDGNAQAPGIPLATVGPSGPLGGSDILLTFRNAGDVRMWGTDLSAEFAATDRVVMTGGYSWVSRDFFPSTRPDLPDISTNAPRSKAVGSIRYHHPDHDVSAEVRGRYAGAFHMVDGMWNGNVKRFAVADVEVGATLPRTPAARLTLTLQNVTDDRHAEFYAHPVLGRLFLTRLQYRF
jgi:outer membrane receptor protein involved in Fe transport